MTTQRQATSGPMLRAFIRSDLLDKGMPTALVDETVDLAFHAAAEATRTLLDVCKRASQPLVRDNATSVALTLAGMTAEAMLGDIAAEFDASGDGHQLNLGLARDVARAAGR